MFNYKVMTENYTKYKDKTKMMSMIWEHSALRGFPTTKDVLETSHYVRDKSRSSQDI